MFPTRLIDPRRLDYHRRMADLELAPVRIAADLTLFDAARQVAKGLGFELCMERTSNGLFLVWAIAMDGNVDDAEHAWPKAAMTRADALMAQVCLLLDSDCQIFFEPHEVRRYLPASLGGELFPAARIKPAAAAATKAAEGPQTLSQIVAAISEGVSVMIEGVDSCVQRVANYARQQDLDVSQFKEATRRFTVAARLYLDQVLTPASRAVLELGRGDSEGDDLVKGLQVRGQIVFRTVTLCLRNVFIECQRLLTTKPRKVRRKLAG